MWGLAIGAAMGGGIAALRGGKTDEILQGAIMGGATGAIGGGISSLAGASAGLGGATVEGIGNTVGSTALVDGGAAATAFPVTGGSNLVGTQFAGSVLPNATASTGAEILSTPALQQAAGNTTNLATTAAPTIGSTPQTGIANGKGFFDSGFGKTLADNKGMLGMGALGLLALKPQGSGSGDSEQESFIRPYTYNPKNQIYSAQAPIKSSDFGTRSVAEGGAIRMAEGGETTQEVRENRTNPTLEALAAIQQSQQTYQPPQQSQGITQPLIQPQMAQIQQQYAAPQRQAPEAFQYQAPSFVKYANVGGGGIAGAGGGGSEAIDPVTKQPVKTVAQIIAAKAAAKPTAPVSGTYTGPGINGDAESYYDRYPIANVYDYTNNQPTRPNNPNEGSPEFNVPSNYPVDPSSGLAEIQQMYANQGYVDFVPDATTDYYGNTGDADGGLIADKHPRYAMGGGIGGYYPEPDDGNRNFGGIGALNQGPQYPMQGIGYAMGGQLGGYSDGGQLLKGPGDGVSDDIPAQIGDRQPARLADGEFVVPARIVSELGNGSTDAGAKRLYAMMDRIQKNRGKTVGKGKVAVNSKSDQYLPA
jgi:hypothetical protein